MNFLPALLFSTEFEAGLIQISTRIFTYLYCTPGDWSFPEVPDIHPNRQIKCQWKGTICPSPCCCFVLSDWVQQERRIQGEERNHNLRKGNPPGTYDRANVWMRRQLISRDPLYAGWSFYCGGRIPGPGTVLLPRRYFIYCMWQQSIFFIVVVLRKGRVSMNETIVVVVSFIVVILISCAHLLFGHRTTTTRCVEVEWRAPFLLLSGPSPSNQLMCVFTHLLILFISSFRGCSLSPSPSFTR